MIDETHSLAKTRRKDETKKRDDGERAMMTYRGRERRRGLLSYEIAVLFFFTKSFKSIS